MNKDKSIKDLKEHNYKLKHQNTLLEIRNEHLEYETNRLCKELDKTRIHELELEFIVEKAMEYIESDEYWFSQVNTHKNLLNILQGDTND